jgi:hypothetical protein
VISRYHNKIFPLRPSSIIYENGKMRPVETFLRRGEGGIKGMMEGVNLTKIYCKHFCKCHDVPQYNSNK